MRPMLKWLNALDRYLGSELFLFHVAIIYLFQTVLYFLEPLCLILAFTFLKNMNELKEM